tara:strand:- start:1098 stop:2366 length:1269 start_codon:yes stop_codon:yes gene_type:complete
MRHLIALLLLLSTTFVGAQPCELPAYLNGLNTGSNMTLLLNENFISSISLTSSSPYIVALTESNLVVGSASLAEEDLNIGMQSVAVWGDDAITEPIDGALSGETISLQVVDGANLYFVNTIPIIFTINGMSLIISGSITFECTGIVLGCTDENACNYDLVANEDDDSCINPLEFYDCDGNCILDTDTDGVCDELEIYGCVEPMACNYNPLATEVTNDCMYPVAYYDCQGNCINDTDGDGICDIFETDGCTNIFACNYLESATEDDGSCIVITAEIFYNSVENILSLETQYDSLEITWLYYNSVIPFEHNDTLQLLEDGIYGVLLYDPINDCGSTDTVHINVVGINDVLYNSIKLYPNPTSDYLNIEFVDKYPFTIFNAIGKVMYESSTNKASISVQSYPVGLYFLKIQKEYTTDVIPWIKVD